MVTKNSNSVSFTDGLRGLKTKILPELSDPLSGRETFLRSRETSSVPFILFLFNQRKKSVSKRKQYDER